jgi:HPt (histidine-containing phosphotransfer) domain-containing protein
MIDTSLTDDAGPIRSIFADDADFAELLGEFAATIPDKRSTVRELLHKSAVDELRVWAHRMKGASGGYGFPGLSAAAAELEQSCKATEAERITRAVDCIVAYLDRIEV